MTEITQQLSSALADRYKIESHVGEGGMATVYLAHDLKHDRKVALKVLRPELAAVIGADRFLQEIKVTANLQHPHILPLHDSGDAGGFLYYVMPYVEGGAWGAGDNRAIDSTGLSTAGRTSGRFRSRFGISHGKHGPPPFPRDFGFPPHPTCTT